MLVDACIIVEINNNERIFAMVSVNNINKLMNLTRKLSSHIPYTTTCRNRRKGLKVVPQ